MLPCPSLDTGTGDKITAAMNIIYTITTNISSLLIYGSILFKEKNYYSIVHYTFGSNKTCLDIYETSLLFILLLWWNIKQPWITAMLVCQAHAEELSLSPCEHCTHFNSDCLYSNANFTQTLKLQVTLDRKELITAENYYHCIRIQDKSIKH